VHDGSLPLLAAALNSDPNPQKGDSSFSLTEGSALMANSGPDGTIADVQHGTVGGEISTYTVEAGDTYSSIASKNGISVNTILWANNLTSKSTLKPGTTLVILPVTGIEHTVTSGETVASLAKKYGGDVQDILTINGLTEGEGLTIGDKIVIPDGEPVAAPATSTKTTVKSTAKRSVNLPSVGGFSNPLPGGICTQGIHDNNGVDIGAPTGTPIYAAAAGSVIVARMGWDGGFGNYVVINHANGTQTLYAHMSRLGTSEGSSVAKGELIGYVGTTGKSTGPHLHFEVHKAANPFCGGL
jgi:murein DD-endopeptidase MepM/ murein hydrolase activator NlpD